MSAPADTLSSWPMGNELYARTADLPEVLLSSASWHSTTAVRHFVDERRHELLQAAVSVGVAAELLMKAFIASEAPPLVADRGDSRSVLQAMGHKSLDPAQALHFRSVGGVELIKLFRQVFGSSSLPPAPADFKPFRVRNAASHMALVESGELRDAVTEYCRLSLEILPRVKISLDDFWGADTELVRELASEAKGRTLVIARAKVAAAQSRIREKLGGLSDVERVRFLAMLGSGIVHTSFGFSDLRSTQHEETVVCPGCKAKAVLVYEAAREGPVEWDEFEGEPYLEVTGYPIYFLCHTCELELVADELEVSDELTQVIPLEPDYEGGARYLASIDF